MSAQNTVRVRVRTLQYAQRPRAGIGACVLLHVSSASPYTHTVSYSTACLHTLSSHHVNTTCIKKSTLNTWSMLDMRVFCV
jgi:hypothetical protein